MNSAHFATTSVGNIALLLSLIAGGTTTNTVAGNLTNYDKKERLLFFLVDGNVTNRSHLQCSVFRSFTKEKESIHAGRQLVAGLRCTSKLGRGTNQKHK